MKKILTTLIVSSMLLVGCAESNEFNAPTNNAGTLSVNVSEEEKTNTTGEIVDIDVDDLKDDTDNNDEILDADTDADDLKDTTDNNETSEAAVDDLEDTTGNRDETPDTDVDDTQDQVAEENTPEQSNGIIEIKEKMFVSQTNDIYINADEYIGKTIKYEGIFESYYWSATDTTYYHVIRYGPGCCGLDSNVGFEIIYDGGYPNRDDWVEVIGVLETYEEEGYDFLRLNVSSLKVMETRGQEIVEH